MSCQRLLFWGVGVRSMEECQEEPTQICRNPTTLTEYWQRLQMLTPHCPLNNRITPRNKTRPFQLVAKPLKISRPSRSSSKSRSRHTGKPEPSTEEGQALLQPQMHSHPQSHRPVLRDVAGAERPRSTSRGAAGADPFPRGNPQSGVDARRAPRHTHARAPTHVQHAHTWLGAARREGGC